METLLTQEDAAQRLGISPRSLERHRVAGTGPRFCKLGRLVKYRKCDLEAWIEASVRSSTSEVA